MENLKLGLFSAAIGTFNYSTIRQFRQGGEIRT